jgi:hypothetical protein
MVESTELKWLPGDLQWHDRLTEFHKNLPIGSKVIGRLLMDRQTKICDLISLTFLFQDSRLKIELIF